MRRFQVRVLVALAAFVALFASSGAGQTVGDASGAIGGTITDQTGGALRDVVVRVSGAASMQTRSVVSLDDGSYHLAGLQPGEYSVTFTLGSFQPARREGIPVTIGATTTVSVVLTVAGKNEVTVRGDPQLLDHRSTTLASRFDARQLASLPGSRSVDSLLAATAAVRLTRVDVGGSTLFDPGPFSAYGITGFSNPTVEGISVSRFNALGFSLDYGSFAEVRVGLGAYGPERPSPGAHVQILTKSGGNEYHGSAHAAYQGGGWQSQNIDADQVSRGAAAGIGVAPMDANRLHAYHDLNTDVGGFLEKDRIWMYLSARDQAAASMHVAFPAPIENRATSAGGKLTVRLNEGAHLVAFVQRGITRQPIRLNAFLRDLPINATEESTTARDARGAVWKLEWNGVVRRRLFAEARVGQFGVSRAERPKASSLRFEDAVDLDVRGGNREWEEALQRDQVAVSVSYVGDGRLRRHRIKVGMDIDRWTATETWRKAYPGDVLHVLRRGAPSEVYLFQTPSRSLSGQWWYAAHGSDSWQVSDRVTVNAGLRFDRFRIYLPEQSHPAGVFTAVSRTFPAVDPLIDWNVMAPRIGLSYGVGRGGRTLIKSSYGLYWLPPGTELGFNANPNARSWWKRYAWIDSNASGAWDPQDEIQLREVRGGSPMAPIDPDLKLSYVHEVTAAVEREVRAAIAVRTSLVWRGARQQGVRQPAAWPFEAFVVPTPVSDPGPDGVLQTGDDGAGIVAYDLRPDLLGSRNVMVRNAPRSNSEYLTWQIGADRRFRTRWSLTAAFAHTWHRDHASSYLGQPVRANAYPLTPNDLIHTDAGGRHVFTMWDAKIHGTYAGPWSVSVTPLLRVQSGQPFGRTIVADLQYASVRVLAEPIGSRRQDTIAILDVGLQKDLRVAGRRLPVSVEIFNLLNANPEQNVSWASGPSFLRPLSIVAPRIARLGVRLAW